MPCWYEIRWTKWQSTCFLSGTPWLRKAAHINYFSKLKKKNLWTHHRVTIHSSPINSAILIAATLSDDKKTDLFSSCVHSDSKCFKIKWEK